MSKKSKYETIIERLQSHHAEMKLVREEERKIGELFVNGYNCGIQDGLEAAINIIKKMEDEYYCKKTDAIVKKAKERLHAVQNLGNYNWG